MSIPDPFVVEGVDRHGEAVKAKTYDGDLAVGWADGINARGGRVTLRRLVYDGPKATFVDPEDHGRPPEGDA